MGTSAAMAIPSPVVTAGFVVSAKACPAPPVASSVARANTASSVGTSSTVKKWQPHTRPSRTIRSSAQQNVRTLMFAAPWTFSSSARTSSQPVASPKACSTRLRECAA